MNSKADVDFFTWIFAFLIIVFVMFIFLIIVFINFGKNSFFGDKVDVSVIDRESEYLLHSSFLNILQKKIVVNGKEDRIMNHIKTSLDPFFLITNNEGKTFIEMYGIDGISIPEETLRDKMDLQGFDDEDWREYIEIHRNIQHGELVQKLSQILKTLCDEGKNKFYFEVPYGYITEDGLKSKINFGEVYFSESYTSPIKFQLVYRGENFEVSLRLLKTCNFGGKIKNDEYNEN